MRDVWSSIGVAPAHEGECSRQGKQTEPNQFSAKLHGHSSGVRWAHSNDCNKILQSFLQTYEAFPGCRGPAACNRHLMTRPSPSVHRITEAFKERGFM